MADIKNSFLELPNYLLEQEDNSVDLLASCSDLCIDSWDCQSDGGSCSRDGCSDCSDCTDCDDSIVETSITLESLTSTSDSITARCKVTVRYTTSVLYVVLRLNGSLTEQSDNFSLSAGGSRTITVTKDGLQPNTYYSVEAILYNAYGQVVKDAGGISTTSSVQAWDWNKSAQTQQAYRAITQAGYLSDFKYTVWNDMVDKAVEIIAARGAQWNNDYGTVAESKMVSSNRILTAKKFNALWWNLKHFTDVSGVQKAVTGGKIYGSYFIALTDAMNSIII